MNQSVQILDGFVYNSEKAAIELSAMNAGQIILCFISDIDEQGAQKFYRSYQFDIEETLTELIDDEKWNESGEVWISALNITL